MMSTVNLGFVLGCILLAVHGQDNEFAPLCQNNNDDLRLVTVPDTGCKRFAVCEHGSYYGVLQCPQKTLFDADKQICEHEMDVNCEPAPYNPDCLNGVNPNNCSMFHLCYLGRQYDFTCNVPLVYSSTHLVCVYPEDLTADEREMCNYNNN